ncbi:hypothetical protein FOMPIDRAFT_1054358 [Fomitopsis schrenkii]|uniref:Uncharacterized protein n=1 Tax=Fomitopsis schrenkii TaxID=2126942 RepID=S8DVR9_FOMSC|nr:hypothetical protein FOMPIDRAFT_1054358 [Fomitopsis schrenkii]
MSSEAHYSLYHEFDYSTEAFPRLSAYGARCLRSAPTTPLVFIAYDPPGLPLQRSSSSTRASESLKKRLTKSVKRTASQPRTRATKTQLPLPPHLPPPQGLPLRPPPISHCRRHRPSPKSQPPRCRMRMSQSRRRHPGPGGDQSDFYQRGQSTILLTGQEDEDERPAKRRRHLSEAQQERENRGTRATAQSSKKGKQPSARREEEKVKENVEPRKVAMEPAAKRTSTGQEEP